MPTISDAPSCSCSHGDAEVARDAEPEQPVEDGDRAQRAADARRLEPPRERVRQDERPERAEREPGEQHHAEGERQPDAAVALLERARCGVARRPRRCRTSSPPPRGRSDRSRSRATARAATTRPSGTSQRNMRNATPPASSAPPSSRSLRSVSRSRRPPGQLLAPAVQVLQALGQRGRSRPRRSWLARRRLARGRLGQSAPGPPAGLGRLRQDRDRIAAVRRELGRGGAEQNGAGGRETSRAATTSSRPSSRSATAWSTSQGSPVSTTPVASPPAASTPASTMSWASLAPVSGCADGPGAVSLAPGYDTYASSPASAWTTSRRRPRRDGQVLRQPRRGERVIRAVHADDDAAALAVLRRGFGRDDHDRARRVGGELPRDAAEDGRAKRSAAARADDEQTRRRPRRRPPAGARPGCPRRRARRRLRRRGSRSAPRPPPEARRTRAAAPGARRARRRAGAQCRPRPRSVGRVDSTDDRAGHRDPPGSLVRSSRRSANPMPHRSR